MFIPGGAGGGDEKINLKNKHDKYNIGLVCIIGKKVENRDSE